MRISLLDLEKSLDRDREALKLLKRTIKLEKSIIRKIKTRARL